MQIVWTKQAEAELRSAVRYARGRWPVAAEQIASHMLASVARLGQFPELGRPGAVGRTRGLVLTRYPLTIVYAPGAEAVTVLRVFHQRQKWPTSPC